MCKFINPHTQEKKDIMPSCDLLNCVFHPHQVWIMFVIWISNKSDDVIVLNDLVEFNFLTAASFCCEQYLLCSTNVGKKYLLYFCTLHCITSVSDSKLSNNKKLPEKIACDGYGAKKSVAVKTLLRLLTCLEY